MHLFKYILNCVVCYEFYFLLVLHLRMLETRIRLVCFQVKMQASFLDLKGNSAKSHILESRL